MKINKKKGVINSLFFIYDFYVHLVLINVEFCSYMFDSLYLAILAMRVHQHLNERKSVSSLDDKIALIGL